MKKYLSLVLSLVLALSLTACGTSPNDVKTPSNVSGVTDGQDKKPAEPTKEVEEPAETAEPTAPSTPDDVTIEETVLLDEQGVKITAKSLEMDSLFGPEVKLLIENDSGKNLTVQCRDSSVNGYMTDTMMSVEVADGKKANDELTFSDTSLKECGIETIADMEFSFHIFDEDWDTYLDTPPVRLKTSAAETYQYTFDDSGDVAYEGNGVKVVVKGLSEDNSIFGPGIVVYMENNGEKNVTVQTRDVSVNGFMVDAMFSSDVVAGKRAVDAITFMSSDLEDNGITDIKDVELSFHIFDSNWNTVVDTDVVSISF